MLKLKSLVSRDERREIISAICHINHVVYGIAQMAGDHKAVLNWPCISFGEEKLDPLRDIRVVKILRKLHKQQCCAVWSFGQEASEEGHNLKIPQGITTNTRKQFVVADNSNCEIKVFDSKGKFLSHFPILSDKDAALRVRSVATDRNDKMYILVDSEPANTVYVFSHMQANLNSFSLKKRLRGRSMTGNNKNQVLVLVEEDRSKTPSACMTIWSEVEVYCSNGRFVRRFGQGILKDAVDITAIDDGGVLVLQENSYVHVFDPEGSHVHQFDVVGNTSSLRDAAIVFQQATEHVFVASSNSEYDRLQVSIYSKSGSFLRSIQLHDKRKWCVTGITVTMQLSIAVSIYDESEVDSKVLVV